MFPRVAENPTWGAPRIQGELLKLGLDISERTVSRWIPRAPRRTDPSKRWKAFLSHHRELIAAMDFLTAPTLTFGLRYCFFLIAPCRRRILPFKVTKHPTSFWVAPQLREAFSYEDASKYVLFDHDAKFGSEVIAGIDAIGVTAVRTSFRSPWQNGVAERWLESCRRDLLD